jgi:hypothetical protein
MIKTTPQGSGKQEKLRIHNKIYLNYKDGNRVCLYDLFILWLMLTHSTAQRHKSYRDEDIFLSTPSVKQSFATVSYFYNLS